MEHNTENPIEGAIFLTVTGISFLVSLVTVKDAVQVGAGLLAAGSALMAIRYYYYATKKVK